MRTHPYSNGDKPPGRVVTFYSFKGGVGRSMALANVAVLMARNKQKVLCIDWDLEAPGLHDYFRAFPENSHSCIPSLSKPLTPGGLLDILRTSKPERVASWNEYVQKRTCEHEVSFDYIGSGDEDPDYSRRLGQFSWAQFFAEKQGGKIVEALRDQWKAHYDYILIDSRTGLTDSSGVCTIQMPDVVVLLFTANRQNITWSKRVALALREGRDKLPYDREFLPIIPVLSRFDAREESDRAGKILDETAKGFEAYFSDWLPRSIEARDVLAWSVLPYVPRYSFEEALAVEDEPTAGTQSLSFHYKLLADLLVARWKGVRAILAGVGVPGAALAPPLPSATELRAQTQRDPSLIERYRSEILERAEEAPLKAAEELETLAKICADSSLAANAEGLLKDAIRLLDGGTEPKSEQVPRLMGVLADVVAEIGRVSEAETLHLEAIERAVEDFGEESAPTASARAVLMQFRERRLLVDRRTTYGTEALPSTQNGHLVGRRSELDELTQALDDSRVTIVGVVGEAGVGKSVLIREWLRSLDPPPSRVFVWSFNDPDASISSNSSLFFNVSLPYFGHTEALPRSDETRGQALAELLAERDAILVLNGTEPMQQSSVDGDHSAPGFFRDAGLRRLLISVLRQGVRLHRGLIVVSSRAPFPDLSVSRNRREVSGQDLLYKEIRLDSLSKEGGAALLKELGVEGQEKELEAASAEVGGNPLCLVLMGNLLVHQWHGDVSLRHRILGASQEGRPLERIMGCYDGLWRNGTPERALLEMMSLFHRPMTLRDYQALVKSAELAAPLRHLQTPDSDGHRSLSDVNKKLEAMGLLFPETKGQKRKIWDTHTLVRDFFRESLRENWPEYWRNAQQVLFHYFREVPAKEYPDTLLDLDPLYRAVHHGCLGGLFREALNVYTRRINRRDDIGYSTNVLGGTSQDLAALQRFFSEGDALAGLPKSDRRWLNGRIAFCFMVLGLLPQAIERRTDEMQAFLAGNPPDWMNAARCAGDMIDLYTLQGRLEEAEEMSKEALKFVDRDPGSWMQWGQRRRSYVKVGSIRFRKGDLRGALESFRHAENLQRERPSEGHLLHSEEGWPYCRLLIEMAGPKDTEEIQQRAKLILVWDDAASTSWRLPVALDHLALGMALMGANDLGAAYRELDTGVQLLRSVVEIVHLPEALLARANCQRQRGLLDEAQADIEEAADIATRYGMPLYRVEANILYANVLLDLVGQETSLAWRRTAGAYSEDCVVADSASPTQGDTSQLMQSAAEAIAEAKTAVEDTKYELVRAEIDMLSARWAMGCKRLSDARDCLTRARKRIDEIGQLRLVGQCEKIGEDIRILDASSL